MKTSKEFKNITEALLKAQVIMEGAVKEAKNPYFKSTYADLPAVMEVCKKPLNDNGITILQPIMNDVLETYLIHTSGEWLCSETKIVCKEEANPQAYGSAITYARRYGLQSLLFIPAEDDDGEKAINRQKAIEKPLQHIAQPVTQTVVPNNTQGAVNRLLADIQNASTPEDLDDLTVRLKKAEVLLKNFEMAKLNKEFKTAEDRIMGTAINPDTLVEEVFGDL